MAKDPAVLFYTSDFLTGTMTMTHDQVGKYIRLLCLQHQKGPLSDKDMLNICGSYDEDVYNKFKKVEDGMYINIRLLEETERRNKYCQSRSKNREGKGATYVKHMETENETENIKKDRGKGEREKQMVLFRVAWGADRSGFKVMAELYADGKYAKYDLDHYYDILLNWSNSGDNKKVDWIATCANFIRSDELKRKAVLKKAEKKDIAQW